jgi:hypothetical protein
MKNVPAVANYPLKSVSCSGTSCVALASECGIGGCGGLLPAKPFYSTNKGTSWTPGAIPGSVGDAGKVSCGSPTLCIAIATKGPLGPHDSSALIVTRNGGKSWSVTLEPKYILSAAVCASAKDCFALGATKSDYLTGVSLFSTNGGMTWASGGFPSKLYYIQSAACSSVTACVAAGSDKTYAHGVTLMSSNVGRSWKDVPAPADTLGIQTVDCDGATCLAVNTTQAVISKNGGKSWVLHPLPTGRTYQSGSCFSATQCIVVGYSDTASPEAPAADITGNSGLTWSPQALPKVDGALSGATCEPGVCLAVGIRVVYAGKTPKAEYPLVLGY